MNLRQQTSAEPRIGHIRGGTTLQRRLVLFFAAVTASLIAAFALLLLLFGINGRGEKAALSYMTSELSHASRAIGDDFELLSLAGVRLSAALAESCDSFFAERGIEPGELSRHPLLLESLIAGQMPLLSAAMSHNAASGVFLLLDATVAPRAEGASAARAGFYMRATRPLPAQAVGAKYYCLRGPAQVARDNGIELLGQWRMEYDVSGQDFFDLVMDTARENASLPLSRLYYWTGRVTLHGNSEAGFLLCVPLRSGDGTVFGVCGLEVSGRLFKQLYSPKESDYRDIFALASPSGPNGLYASRGLIAGNSYLTGRGMDEELSPAGQRSGFYRFRQSGGSYGGLTEALTLYPADSPFSGEVWSVAVLMPQAPLDAVIRGSSPYFFLIVALLLLGSLAASVFISRRYLGPVKKALSSIRSSSYGTDADVPYLEIKDLFVFLSDKDGEHERELNRLEEQRRGALSEAERARRQAALLAEKKRAEIDRDSYELFLTRLGALTPKERQVFGLYLEGRSAKEIVSLLGFSENALKYHNKNIYSKLGVSSRRELLMYAALMKGEK